VIICFDLQLVPKSKCSNLREISKDPENPRTARGSFSIEQKQWKPERIFRQTSTVREGRKERRNFTLEKKKKRKAKKLKIKKNWGESY
jgi:hypothetical protein